MSGLKGRTVRIIISEPYEENQKNLFGTIISAQGKSEAIVKLTKIITGPHFTTDLLRVACRHKGESLMALEQNYAVTITGVLVNYSTNEPDFTIIGNMTFD